MRATVAGFSQLGSVSHADCERFSLDRTVTVCPGSYRSLHSLAVTHDSARQAQPITCKQARPRRYSRTLLAFSDSWSVRASGLGASINSGHQEWHAPDKFLGYEHILIRLFQGASEPGIFQVDAAQACSRLTVRHPIGCSIGRATGTAALLSVTLSCLASRPR